MPSPRQDKKYNELMDQACEAMLAAGKVRNRTDLSDVQKHELWKKLTRQSIDLHNQAVAFWKSMHGSDPSMPMLTDERLSD